MDSTFNNQLLQYGIAAPFIVFLIWGLSKFVGLYIQSMEARIAEKETLAIAIKNSTDAINGHTKAVEALTAIVRSR